jgi:hypothetical protein
MWKYNSNILLAGGPCSWFSTTKAGECKPGQRPGAGGHSGAGCTWRVAEVGTVVNASCLDGLVIDAVRASAAGTRCFAGCPDSSPPVRPDDMEDCQLNCFYEALLGESPLLHRRSPIKTRMLRPRAPPPPSALWIYGFTAAACAARIRPNSGGTRRYLTQGQQTTDAGAVGRRGERIEGDKQLAA